MSVTTLVKLVGGPMGGETRAFEGLPETRLRVPALQALPATPSWWDSDDFVTFEYEEYELRRSSGGEYVYQWVDDRPRLRKELDKLRAQLEAVREAVGV